jgi:hypothetical protein
VILDLLIYKIGFVVLLLSVFRRQALLVAFLLCASFAYSRYIFVYGQPSWAQLENWAALSSIKDALIMIILLSRLKTPEFILGLSFAISGLFHQFMLIEVENHILLLKHARTDFMVILTAFQLALVIFILIQGSGNNGGKRAKHYFHLFHGRFIGLLHLSTHKVKT